MAKVNQSIIVYNSSFDLQNHALELRLRLAKVFEFMSSERYNSAPYHFKSLYQRYHAQLMEMTEIINCLVSCDENATQPHTLQLSEDGNYIMNESYQYYKRNRYNFQHCFYNLKKEDDMAGILDIEVPEGVNVVVYYDVVEL